MLRGLYLFLLLAAAPVLVQAQADSTAVTLPTTVVTYRVLTTPFGAARSTEVLGDSLLRQLPAVSINDALHFSAGLDVRERGPLGVQADLAFRGGTFNQTLVMIDGLKLSDPLTGHHSLNLPIPVQAIGSVEILKGPAARSLGQNAFAGALNITPATYVAPTLSLTYGEHNLSSVNFTTGIASATGKSSHLLSAGYTYSDGYTQNTDFGMSQLFYYGRFYLENEDGNRYTNHIVAMAGYSARHFGAANFYFTPSREYEATESWITALGYRTDKLLLNLYWRRHFDDYRPFREQTVSPRNRHSADGISLDGNYSFRALGGTTAIGFDLKNEQLRSNNLGSHYRWTGGLYAEQAWTLGRWFISPGAYLNYFSDFGWAAYPGMDVAFRPTTETKLYATTGRAYRIPTYIDLYLNTSQNRGNPNLAPERAWSYEVGAEWQPGRWQLRAALFQREGADLIDYARADTATSGPFVARNVNNLTTRGLEGSLERRFTGPIQQLRVAYTYLEQDNDPGDFTSRYVFDFLRHQVVSSVDVAVLDGRLTTRPLFRYEKRAFQRENYLLDLRINAVLGAQRRYTVFLEGTNLFNRPYADIGGAVLPGRWLRGGVVVRFAEGPLQ